MDGVKRAYITGIAERLYGNPSETDYQQPPTSLADCYPAPSTPEQRVSVGAEILRIIEGSVGLPTQYGGTADGPSIRWRSETHTLLLDHSSSGFQLSVHKTRELDRRELALFRHGVGSDVRQAASYGNLPYLWQLHRDSSGTPAAPTPATHPAPDWARLEESMGALLNAWSEQLPAQLGEATAAFNIVNHADGDRVLSVLYSPEDGLMALINGEGMPGDSDYLAGMASRGWRSKIPVARWWETSVTPGREGASTLAKLIASELRHRGARSPRDLGLSDLSATHYLESGDLGPAIGRLFLPGLGISNEP